MCGIAGAIGWFDGAADDALDRITRAQAHRGPDDDGTWKSFLPAEGYGAAFAFRRLAIIDLSPDGHQPMLDPDTGNVIVFNGELYNYRSIREQLVALGKTFRSRSDTEVLLKAYAKWGLDALSRLRGMFAFAIWDASRRQVVLARDRLGIKPLYFATAGRSTERKTVFFSSELRSLLAGGIVERRLNPAAVASYVWNGFVVGPETIVSGIELLPAGAAAVVGVDGDMAIQRYWTMPRYAPKADGVERLDEALQTSISQHLASDVPLGVFLSGGVDSSAVTAIAAKAAGARVQTFNLCFDEDQYDESPYARAVAQAVGTEHTEVKLTRSDFKTQINAALGSIDQPTFDAINSYFVSRAVREAGMTVALAGTGGDELFGGYSSYVDIPRARCASRLLSPVPSAAIRYLCRTANRFRNGGNVDVPPQTRWGKLADVLQTRGDLLALYQTTYALFTADFAAELLGGPADIIDGYGMTSDRARELRHMTRDDELLHSISVLELSNFIGERLLRDTDAASMAVSLEVRVPLLDHEVVEAVASVETDKRFQPLRRKMLLRRLALADLPASQFDRPKQGFGLPMAEWCRDTLRGDIDAAFSDRAACEAIGVDHRSTWNLWQAFKSGAAGIYWSRIWSIFVLMNWCRAHAVSR